MSVASDLVSELASNLEDTKRTLAKLQGWSRDFTSCILLNQSFQDFEDECTQFVDCHFGMPLKPKVVRKKGRK